MRELFLIAVVMVFAFGLRSGCSQEPEAIDRVNRECKKVCQDVGDYDGDYAVKTGVFSYQCYCKRKPVKMPKRR